MMTTLIHTADYKSELLCLSRQEQQSTYPYHHFGFNKLEGDVVGGELLRGPLGAVRARDRRSRSLSLWRLVCVCRALYGTLTRDLRWASAVLQLLLLAASARRVLQLVAARPLRRTQTPVLLLLHALLATVATGLAAAALALMLLRPSLQVPPALVRSAPVIRSAVFDYQGVSDKCGVACGSWSRAGSTWCLGLSTRRC